MFASSFRAGIITVTRGAGEGNSGIRRNNADIRRRPSNIERIMNPQVRGPSRTYTAQNVASSQNGMGRA